MARHILVVDDSTTIRMVLRNCLVPAGYKVTEAGDGEEGLAQAALIPYDAVVVDVNMPGMNGLEMIERLRATKGYEKTPIFVLTTESTRLAQAGRKVGATAWLVKPFRSEVLLKGLAMVLK